LAELHVERSKQNAILSRRTITQHPGCDTRDMYVSPIGRFVSDRAPLQNKRLGAAAVVAVAVFVSLYVPEPTDGSGALLGGAFAFVAVAIGLAAVAHVRPLPSRIGSPS